MAFYNPVTVELYDTNDKIINAVARPISITQNWDAYDFNYVAVQVETFDALGRDIMKRWADGEHIQYKLTSRAGTDTGDINSIYNYSEGSNGEFTLYGRSHKEILRQVLGYIPPRPLGFQTLYPNDYSAVYSGTATQVVCQVLKENFVDRMGQKMTFPTDQTPGNQITVDFRFDEIYQHLYEDGEDRGGVKLQDNGDVVFHIYRDFAKHTYVLTARKPTHHKQPFLIRSGLVDRWQVTSDRGEGMRVVVGGPGEAKARIFSQNDDKPLVPGKNHYRFAPEVFTEDTSPDVGGKQDPTQAEQLAAIHKTANTKAAELAGKSGTQFTLAETDTIYLGGTLKLGDYVTIGMDDNTILGEIPLSKAVTTWTSDGGYQTTISDTDIAETTDSKTITTITKAVRNLATKTRRI